jgi:hypothetical protein
MHRSGTSCLTGSLQHAGLQLGKYHSWNRYNQKGNRENQDIVDFHEALLAANGASWDNPPARLKFDDSDVARARALIDAYRGKGPWGFKDPRALLALPLWQKAAPDIRYIGIFRHPRSVAESVSNRSGGRITLEHALQLWYQYNRLLYKTWRKRRFPVLCFDWDEQEFHRRLEPIIASLQLAAPADAEPFYSRDLLHYEAQRWDGIPWRIRRLYKKLVAASEHQLSQMPADARQSI